MKRHYNNAGTAVSVALLFGLASVAVGARSREAWVGERVVFQDEQVNREIGFQQYRWTPEPTEGHCRYGDLAGKLATVVAAREVEPGRWLVTLELDSSKRRVYTDVAGFALRNVGFLSEAESARQWVGQTFYNRVHGPRATGHARNRVYAWRPLEELAARLAGDSGHAEV
ncbi:hypothetical protein JXB37_00840, partial [candidate division WOR-3 bacterium]|nr:hypothetical protein [candidate division WOR-3 bacterium]